MNSMELKDKLRNISKERNIDFNTLLRLYMYDRFIERLSLQEIEEKTGTPISTAWLRIEKIKKLIYYSNCLINPENQAENRR